MGRLAPPVIPATGTQPCWPWLRSWSSGILEKSLDLLWVKTLDTSGNTEDHPTSEQWTPRVQIWSSNRPCQSEGILQPLSVLSHRPTFSHCPTLSHRPTFSPTFGHPLSTLFQNCNCHFHHPVIWPNIHFHHHSISCFFKIQNKFLLLLPSQSWEATEYFWVKFVLH